MKSLQHHFLLPLPNQDGSYFDGTLTYICHHSEVGATGFVVNRLTDFDLNRMLGWFDIEQEMQKAPPVYEGGPVEQKAPSILHTDDLMVEGSLELPHGLGLTLLVNPDTFKSMLERIASGEGPRNYVVMLGYAGWSQNQLDTEINNNVWITCPGSHELLFDVPASQRADQAAQSIGIDLDLLSGGSAGSA